MHNENNSPLTNTIIYFTDKHDTEVVCEMFEVL